LANPASTIALIYIVDIIRESVLSKIFTLIDDGGLLITGFNHPFGIYARYSVYTKDKTGVSPLEFSFSMDNLRPLGVGPWLTLADEDREPKPCVYIRQSQRSKRD
jgi:hypothetical protein